jgi:hypothetical protein
MTPDELRALLTQPDEVRPNAFAIAKAISRLCHSEETLSEGREMVIRALEHYAAFESLGGVLDGLVSQVGLFPYADSNRLSITGQLAYEFHRPLEMELDDRGIVLP